MRRTYYLIFLITSLAFQVKAQSSSADLAPYRHHIANDDHQLSFYTISPDQSVGAIKPNRSYYWWSGKQIQVTQGGYSGKLLHGVFTVYYLNKQLKEQGSFKKGLKNGEWKEWNENGKLTLRTNYFEGVADGSFYKYNDLGQLQEQGTYKGGKINGKLSKYVTPDSAAVTKYRNGILVPEKKETGGKPWWKFWKKKEAKQQ